MKLWDWICGECGAGRFKREAHRCSRCGHVGESLPAGQWRRSRAWLAHKGFRVIDGGRCHAP